MSSRDDVMQQRHKRKEVLNCSFAQKFSFFPTPSVHPKHYLTFGDIKRSFSSPITKLLKFLFDREWRACLLCSPRSSFSSPLISEFSPPPATNYIVLLRRHRQRATLAGGTQLSFFFAAAGLIILAASNKARRPRRCRRKRRRHRCCGKA